MYYCFKENISANETINYILNTTGLGEVNVRFYSDEGIDINIVERDVKNIVGVVENKFENIKKKDYKIKGGLDKVGISIKGKKDGKYRVIVTWVKKNVGKNNHPEMKKVGK